MRLYVSSLPKKGWLNTDRKPLEIWGFLTFLTVCGEDVTTARAIMESMLDPNHIEGRIAGMGLTKGPIFQGPDFRAPEIKPRQTRLEKFAALVASRTPQEKGALIGLFGTFTVTLLLSLSQCSRVSTENAILKHDTQNMGGKIREQDTTILKLSTEKASLESRLTTFESSSVSGAFNHKEP